MEGGRVVARLEANGGILGDLLARVPEEDSLVRPGEGKWCVRDGGFRERTAASLLAEFRAERAKSLAWLRSLPSPDWSKSKVHPRIGPFAAGDLLASWAAHDLLHARQVVRILHGIAVAEGAPFSTRYAGEW